MRLTEEFSLDLLRHFLPSAKVEKYRFRGLRVISFHRKLHQFTITVCAMLR